MKIHCRTCNFEFFQGAEESDKVEYTSFCLNCAVKATPALKELEDRFNKLEKTVKYLDREVNGDEYF